MNITGLIIGIIISGSISGVLIWLVSLLGLGLQVDGLGPAFIAGFAIAAVGGVITWPLSIPLKRINAAAEQEEDAGREH